MSAAQERVPTREECIHEAGALYASILNDPVRAAQIRKRMAEYDAELAAAQQSEVSA